MAAKSKRRVTLRTSDARHAAFAEVADLIQRARSATITIVNTALVDLYWQIGKTISKRIAVDGWGKGTVAALAVYIESQQRGPRGFSAQNLWRMSQFYEAYADRPKLSNIVETTAMVVPSAFASKNKAP